MTNLNNIQVLTGTSAVISAAHRARDGNLHGHTWEVTAWRAEGQDAVVFQKSLQDYLAIFDHTVLGDDCAWGEALAKAVLIGLDCVRVEVSRPLEKLYAIAEKRP